MHVQINSLHQEANILLPASKSLSNRALIIQFLCPQAIEINNLSKANDTILLAQILQTVSMEGNKSEDEILSIDVEDAGTPFRFLTALLSTLYPNKFILHGSSRLHQRPIATLIDALKVMGAEITYLQNLGFAPIQIQGKNLLNNQISINGSTSSQFASALCLIAPKLENGLTLEITDSIISAPYIDMTLGVMENFGIQINRDKTSIHIAAQNYLAKNYSIENDWSSATFFYCIAMLLNEPNLTFQHLFQDSLQGDAFIQNIAIDFGIKTTFQQDTCNITRYAEPPFDLHKNIDLSYYPDLAVPFIVVCALKYQYVSIQGIYHLEWKESKRISALTTELIKLGIGLIYQNDILTFKQENAINKHETIHLKTYNDHRIAMALSMVIFCGYHIELDDVACVKKSFPNYFEELKKLTSFP